MLRKLLCLVLLWTFALPALAETYMEVPVHFIGDRKPRKLHRSDPGEDQMCMSQFISFGVGKYPVSVSDDTSLANSIRCGGTPVKSAKPKIVLGISERTEENATSVSLENVDGNPFEDPSCTEFIDRFSQFVNETGSDEYVIFVHGCCTSQKLGLQFAGDLQPAFGCPVIAFDWATPGVFGAPPLPEVNTYRKSERAIEISQINFNRMVAKLQERLPYKRVIIVGHSMGNRLIMNYLIEHGRAWEPAPTNSSGRGWNPAPTNSSGRGWNPAPTNSSGRGWNTAPTSPLQISEVHMVRPDLSLPAYVFREKELCNRVGKMFIYVANNDPMLRLSRTISSNISRLGAPDKSIKLFLSHSDTPQNRTIFDISAMNLLHLIPFDLLGKIHRQEETTTIGYVAEPIEAGSDRVLRLRSAKKKSATTLTANRD